MQPEIAVPAIPLTSEKIVADLPAKSTELVVQSEPLAIAKPDGGYWGERFDRWFWGDLAKLWL